MTTLLGPYRLNEIYTGDARELATGIPDKSIDLIICDPVYWEIWQYAWLADTAARVLRDGGNIVAQTGSEYRFRAELAMMNSSLEKRPLLIETYSGGFMQMWKHRSLNGFHAYIWLTKGVEIERETWVHTCVRGAADKSVHTWGDGISFYHRTIQAMTTPGAIVFDPFTGGGTVPAVCKMLHRQYLAFEIDPATADLARERVRNTQPPLPLIHASQGVLL